MVKVHVYRVIRFKGTFPMVHDLELRATAIIHILIFFGIQIKSAEADNHHPNVESFESCR